MLAIEVDCIPVACIDRCTPQRMQGIVAAQWEAESGERRNQPSAHPFCQQDGAVVRLVKWTSVGFRLRRCCGGGVIVTAHEYGIAVMVLAAIASLGTSRADGRSCSKWTFLCPSRRDPLAVSSSRDAR